MTHVITPVIIFPNNSGILNNFAVKKNVTHKNKYATEPIDNLLSKAKKYSP